MPEPVAAPGAGASAPTGAGGQAVSSGQAADGSGGASAAPGASPGTPGQETANPDSSWVDSIPWTTVLIVAIVIVVLAIAIWLFVRWWRRRSKRQSAAESPSLADGLSDIWQPFYRGLPRRALHFPTVVVMGEPGVGKSTLIASRVSWRGQANQYYPSAANSPEMQLYMGPDVVAHELSAPLLRDVSGKTRRALTRMWRHMGPSAVVVAVLDARTLATTPPQTLRELAQLMRGKVRLFPRSQRKRVEMRVVLSNMDQLEGYREFAAVVGAKHGPLDVHLLGEDYVDAAALVAAFDSNLSYGLTSQTGDEFRRLVSFYSKFPAVLAPLAPFLQALRGDDSYGDRYPLSELHLSSLTPEEHVGNPFRADPAQVAASAAQERKRHVYGSLAVAAAGIALVGGLSYWHYNRIADADAMVDAYNAELDATNVDSQIVQAATLHGLRKRASASIRKMRETEWLWLRRSFTERKNHVEETFTQAIRDEYLLPRLKADESVDRLEAARVVSLLYGSRKNALGALVKRHKGLWAGPLDIPAQTIRDYVDNSPARYEPLLPFELADDRDTWPKYLYVHLRPAFEKSTLTLVPGGRGTTTGTTSGTTSGGQATNKRAIDVKNRLPRLSSRKEYQVLTRAIELLSADEALAAHPPIAALIRDPPEDSEWVTANFAQLSGLQSMIANGRVDANDFDTPSSLMQLLNALEALFDSVPASGAVYSFEFVFGGEPQKLEFSAVAWAKLLARTKARLLIDEFEYRHERIPPSLAFFPDRADPVDIPAESGVGVGPTKGLPGQYTADSFARYVAPVLDLAANRLGPPELEGVDLTDLKLLDLAEDDRAQLARFIQRATRQYASDYASSLRTYYDSFEFKPGSEAALPFALVELTVPVSWFTDFLGTVGENAAPKLDYENSYYDPMVENMARFSALAKLLAESEGSIPGIAPYVAIVSELLAALEANEIAIAEAAATGATDDDPSELALDLSPTGMLVLSTLDGEFKDARAQVVGWLQGAGISNSLHEPFLEPVRLMYSVGTANINAEVAEAWREDLRPLVSPLLARFPFNRGSDREVSLAELESVLRAQGEEPGTLWASFAQLLGRVTTRRNGDYRMRTGLRDRAGMLPTINDLLDLSQTLWDADGNRIELPVAITPAPLDRRGYDGRVPTRAYLRSGNASVWAFNQRPERQTLKLAWWDQGTSSVTVEMTKPNTTDTEQHSLEAPDAVFSFYRLLCQGVQPEDPPPARPKDPCWRANGKLTWNVRIDTRRKIERDVTFTLETDPWAPFRIQRKK